MGKQEIEIWIWDLVKADILGEMRKNCFFFLRNVTEQVEKYTKF